MSLLSSRDCQAQLDSPWFWSECMQFYGDYFHFPGQMDKTNYQQQHQLSGAKKEKGLSERENLIIPISMSYFPIISLLFLYKFFRSIKNDEHKYASFWIFAIEILWRPRVCFSAMTLNNVNWWGSPKKINAYLYKRILQCCN